MTETLTVIRVPSPALVISVHPARGLEDDGSRGEGFTFSLYRSIDLKGEEMEKTYKTLTNAIAAIAAIG